MVEITASPDTVARNTFEETSYFVYQAKESEALTENSLNGTCWTLAINVGVARKTTPAFYTVYSDLVSIVKIIFCLNKDNMLQNYEFDDDDGVWSLGTLHQLRALAHPDTKLAALYDGASLQLFYQDPTGAIQQVSSPGFASSWTPKEPLSTARPIIGTCLFALKSTEYMRLFYGHEGSSIHQQVYEDSRWTDLEVVGTSGSNPRDPIDVKETDGQFQISYPSLLDIKTS